MKKTLTTIAFTGCLIGLQACSEDFLEKMPIGAYTEQILANSAGLEGILVGAYANLDMAYAEGTNPNSSGWFAGDPSNWILGDIRGGDSHKGSTSGDQTDVTLMETYENNPNLGVPRRRFIASYDGISRANEAINMANRIAADLTEADKLRYISEARFLRAYYHYELKRTFNMIPFIDETVSGDYKVPNDKDIWPQIEADFKFAYDNLPATMPDVGRANKWAAAAFYGKVLMYQKKFTEAKPVWDNIIANGVTSKGLKYGLNERYHDNFRTLTKNSKESVFAVQLSVNDGASGLNGGVGTTLNFPSTSDGPGLCCSFNTPSFSFVNAFRVDEKGLPMLDNYNDKTVKNDYLVSSTTPFVPETDPVDPRLDWTVGRRGIPYLDWGPMPGARWLRDQAFSGPYLTKKNTYYKSEEKITSDATQPFYWGLTANNYNLIRFADVLLMAAETEIELGGLSQALTYINQVRGRMIDPDGWVKNETGENAANYKIGLYTAFPDKTYAMKVLMFERRLELGQEGHRFYDLVRWGNAKEYLTSYLAYESQFITYLKGATFETNKEEYLPLPQTAIINSQVNGAATLVQNPGY